jgi:farnesyl diphosphate synthase
MIAQLAEASGSQGMAGGQAIDLESVAKTLSLSELEDMHRRKTGALIRASVLLGALARTDTASQVLEDLTNYAGCIGLAFQIMDDVLDVEGDTNTLGKQSGADQARRKPTYPALLGLTQAKAKAAELHTMALASLRRLGDNGRILAHIADYIISRTH